MQNFKKKCMPAAKLLLVKNWGKNGTHLPQPTTRTSLGNLNSYIYTTIIVCNDYTPLSDYIKFQVLKLI